LFALLGLVPLSQIDVLRLRWICSCKITLNIVEGERWRAYLRKFSKEGPILCPKTIRQELIYYSHSIQMD
jgi:hypothetical protein